MKPLTQSATRTDKLFPYTTLFRSDREREAGEGETNRNSVIGGSAARAEQDNCRAGENHRTADRIPAIGHGYPRLSKARAARPRHRRRHKRRKRGRLRLTAPDRKRVG